MIKNKKLSLLPVVIIVFSLLLASCLKTEDYSAEERAKIDAYLLSNPDFTKKESGLYYLELSPGTGDLINLHDTAYVIYTAKYITGQTIETNVGKDSLVFPLGEGWNIPGFEEGISYMNEGAKSLLLVPSSLAYGSIGAYDQQGYLVIPGYTPLLYEVELAKISRTP